LYTVLFRAPRRVLTAVDGIPVMALGGPHAGGAGQRAVITRRSGWRPTVGVIGGGQVAGVEQQAAEPGAPGRRLAGRISGPHDVPEAAHHNERSGDVPVQEFQIRDATDDSPRPIMPARRAQA
jgi:hypothetical protein